MSDLKKVSPLDTTEKICGLSINTYAMVMHFVLVLLLFGMAIALVMWAVGKNSHREIDRHGRVIVNWILSLSLYAVLAAAISYLTPALGFWLIRLLPALTVIFAMIGAVRASSGIVWKYPFSLNFFKKEIS